VKKNMYIIFLTIFYLTLSIDLVYGLTINVSPNPAYINQNVNINITAEFRTTPSCYLEVNFGDSSQWYEIGYCLTTPCVLTTTHSYNTVGVYTISARSEQQRCMSTPLPPDPVSTQINIRCPGTLLDIITPSILPHGISGQSYSYQIQSTGGQGSIVYNLYDGSLPPGLSLSVSGLLSGIPNSPGEYSFTIQATDGCQSVRKEFKLRIECPPLIIISPSQLPNGLVGQFYSYQIQTNGGQLPLIFNIYSGAIPPGINLSTSGLLSGTPISQGRYVFTLSVVDSCPLGQQNIYSNFNIEIQQPYLPISVSVITTPSSINIVRDQSSSQFVNFQFKSSVSTNINMTSDKGIFLVDNEVIYSNERILDVNIKNGVGMVGENLMIPVRVIERAIRKNSANMIYRRVFSGSNLEVSADVYIRITTEAGADFDIKRIELYFENKRAEITISRNYPDLKAFADIRFVGSGLLQGYWEVDGRILSYVNQHLTYGRSITIETPKIPSLPTFDTGTHILRFVITNPEIKIPTPSLIYFVTPSEYPAKALAIELVRPINNKLVDFVPARFEWKEMEGVSLYVIQFYEKDSSKPIFSAYVKEPIYVLPELVFKNIFSRGKLYLWKVNGFDIEKNLVGESEIWTFIFKE